MLLHMLDSIPSLAKRTLQVMQLVSTNLFQMNKFSKYLPAQPTGEMHLQNMFFQLVLTGVVLKADWALRMVAL